MMFNVTLVTFNGKNGDMSFGVSASTVGDVDNRTRLETKSDITGCVNSSLLSCQIHGKKKQQQSTHGKLVAWVGTLGFLRVT